MKKGIRIRLYIEDLENGKRYGTVYTGSSETLRAGLISACAKMADKVVTEYIRRKLIRIIK